MLLENFFVLAVVTIAANFCTSYAQSSMKNVTISSDSSGVQSVSESAGNLTQIHGSRLVDIKEVPYQIALFRDNYFICGGSILSQDWILTAAQCVYGGGSFGIRYGSSNSGNGGNIRFITTIVINGGFTTLNLENDIAMLRTNKPLIWSQYVQPIRLAPGNVSIPEKLFLSGWSSVGEKTRPEKDLRGAVISVVPNGVCRSTYETKHIITKNLICTNATGRDACQGDYGGPLTYNNVLYGIVSLRVGCESLNFPTVYTSVPRQYKWVMNVARRYGGQEPLLAEKI
ncbi:trypsin beta-like [Haematobia irritans]|uniref:trypsin beta-like n=1 Tax=Haematobia irritans TaxID=7368 RepID=UPI003F4F4E48